jgi:hypothetical protein
MAKPICVMVMPFSTKETGLGPDDPGPKQVDFDALWDAALRPAIEDCGYTPVRADADAGALIIVEMIERLAMSDLVVADISIGNANVYYEIGVRHAAQRYGCVLVSANWAHVLFDINQMPRVVYTADDGSIGPTTAATIREQVRNGIAGLKDGESPVYQAVPGFPESAQDDVRVTRFKNDMASLNETLGRMQGIRRIPDQAVRLRTALELRDELAAQDAVSDGVAVEMMLVLRDFVGWDEVISWIDTMPDRLRTRPSIEEQRLLAISKSGDGHTAIGALEQLIRTAGDSSERQGLLGGRYKKLWDAETDADVRVAYLESAIRHYERGMMLDLNDYYPSSNLPRLYRARGDEDDVEGARAAGAIALKASERARAIDPENEWLRPTLLGAAFDARDVAGARRLTSEIRRDRPGDWKLSTTIADLRVSTAQVNDPDDYASLAALFNELNALLPPDERLLPLDSDPPAAAVTVGDETESETGTETDQSPKQDTPATKNAGKRARKQNEKKAGRKKGKK